MRMFLIAGDSEQGGNRLTKVYLKMAVKTMCVSVCVCVCVSACAFEILYPVFV